MLENGADSNLTENREEKSSLLIVCVNVHIRFEIVELLLTFGKADVNKKDCFGRNCLHYISKNENIELKIVEILIKHGAEVDLIDENWGRTPLISSCLNHNNTPQIVSLFLNNKANPNICDSEGKGCLHYLALNRFSNVAIIKKLIKFGIDLNITDPSKNTPLHYLSLLKIDEDEKDDSSSSHSLFLTQPISTKFLLHEGESLSNQNQFTVFQPKKENIEDSSLLHRSTSLLQQSISLLTDKALSNFKRNSRDKIQYFSSLPLHPNNSFLLL